MTSSRAIEPLHYDARGVLVGPSAPTAADLAALAPRLLAAQQEVLADAALWLAGGKVPADKEPLDAGFHQLPERLLAAYRQDRAGSELGQILATAQRLRGNLDRLVVLGIGGSYMGARAMFEACCHPYHNELPASQRGGAPCIYFEGNNVDNDAAQGLIDLLRTASSHGERWGIVVISKSGGTLETAAALRIFWRELLAACGNDAALAAERLVPVTGPSGKLFDLAQALGCRERFLIPEGVGGRFSVLTAVGLLPAAIMGLDIVALLEGAAAMNERFASAPLGDNPVLDYVGVCHELERRGATIRVLSIWSKALEAAGLWYDQLLSESLGKQLVGATPLTVVNTRDLHSRGQQHQEGRRDKLITNLIVERPRCDLLSVGESTHDQDQLNSLAKTTLADIMAAAIAGTNAAYAEDNRPTADLRLPRLSEATLGQLLQMMMLATVAEGRLIGVNPYGQPGVEHYKRNMNAILRGH